MLQSHFFGFFSKVYFKPGLQKNKSKMRTITLFYHTIQVE